VLPQVTELRDVLPTFLDAAGVAVPSYVEGKSLLNLVRGQTDWRPHLDLEHSTCYFKENAWTGLTDGQFKYIFHAYNGKQQLFDLEHDPNELDDLSTDQDHQATLKDWRAKMAQHLAIRGPAWVKDGDLALRLKPMPYGENFPGKT
jgi:arylsulfatase A-like enzyme